MKVVVAAAGEGTRFYPLSRVVPKELFPLGDRPLLQHLLEETVAAGARDVVIVTSPKKPAIARYFQIRSDPGRSPTRVERDLDRLRRRVRIRFVVQRRPLGLADAFARSQAAVGSTPFGALVADTLHGRHPPVLARLREAYRRLDAPGGVVAVRPVPPSELHRYGVILPGPRRRGCSEVLGIVEKPSASAAPSRLALTGAYYLSPAVFDSIRRTRGDHPTVGHLAAAFNDLAARRGLYAWRAPSPPLDVGDLALWRAANRAWPVDGDRSRAPGSPRRSRPSARPG